MNSDLHYTVGLLIVVLIAVPMPVWDYFEAKRLRQGCTSKDRLRYYWTTLIAHVLLGAGSVYCLRGRVLDAGGTLAVAMSDMSSPVRYSLMVLGFLFSLLAVAPLLFGIAKPKSKIRYTKAVTKTPFAFMFPNSRAERMTFAALSVSAGIWEEVIFRSFLVFLLAAPPFNFHPFISLALASILFGVNHGYQGIVGIVKTGVGGFLFGLLYFSTGSLLLAMVIHAITDLSAIYMYRPDLLPGDQGPSMVAQTV